MTNQELSQLANGLPECGKIRDKKIAYAVARNIAKTNTAMKERETNLKALQLVHCKKKDGEPIIINDQIQMDDPKAWTEAWLAFQEEKVDIKLHKIRFSDIPDDVSGNEMATFLNFTDGAPQ